MSPDYLITYSFRQLTFSRLSFRLQQSASFRKEHMSQEWSHVNRKFRDLDVFIALLSVHLRFVAMVSYWVNDTKTP